MSCEELCTRGEVVYIYTSLRGQVCARVIATPSHNNAPGQCCDTSVKTTINFTFNASVLSLVIRVSKALNFNIGALLKVGNSFLKASNYRVGL